MTTFARDGTLHYQIFGTQGPRVVLIQGVGLTGHGWSPQVEALRDRFQFLVIDNRGIGQSLPHAGAITIEEMAADALAALNHAGWPTAHIAGHSMGGVIAQQLALDDPKRVESLALLCTFARGKDAARVTPWIAWVGLRSRVGTKAMRRRAFLEIIMAPEALANVDPEVLAAELAEVFGRDLADQPWIAMRQVQALGAHDTSARLPELRGIPTLVVSAEHDVIALPEYGRQLAAGIEGARFVQLNGTAHSCTVDRAGPINGLLAELWATQ